MGSGELTINTEQYEWERFEDTGLDATDRHKTETTTWPIDAPWPSEMDPTRPPKAVIEVGFNQLFNTLMRTYDHLAQHNVFCAVAALPLDPLRRPVIPLTEPSAPAALTIDPQGKVAVHLKELPSIGGPYGYGHHDDMLIMRGDGSKCTFYKLLMGTRASLPLEPTETLSEFLDNQSHQPTPTRRRLTRGG